MKYNNLIIPIETINRELDAKLLLALYAAEAGFTTQIGILRRIRATSFKPSIIIYKSVRFTKDLNLMQGLGHMIVAWDEEGLARFQEPIHNSRMEPDALSIPKMLFSWGLSNRELWLRHPFYNGTPIVNSGNPRIDLLRPELRALYSEKVKEYQDRYGNFCLLNSNFGYVNNFKASGKKLSVSDKALDPKAYETYRAGIKAHKQKLFQAFLQGVAEIARSLAPHKLIIRPHPSEDHKAWRDAAAGLENVEVIYEDGVVPWILAAKAIIHNGCTTGIEAAIVERAALAYRPLNSDQFDISLPNELSENYTNISDLAERAKALVTGTASYLLSSEVKANLAHNVSSLSGPFASEMIVNSLLELANTNDLRSSGQASAQLMFKAKNIIRRFVSPFRGDIMRYRSHKSGEDQLTVESIRQASLAYSKILGRFENLQFEEFAPGIVTIRKIAQAN